MAYLKFSPDEFLEVNEMDQLRTLLDEKGFRKNVLDNTIKFGLIKNSADINFTNGHVDLDLDAGGFKTVKVRAVKGIDVNGQFFVKKETPAIAIPSDSNWYWLKVRHEYSNIEDGVFSIAANGDLIDTSGNAKLTKIFRGMPNFPTRIRFVGSTYNQLEYDVLDITDDQNATIQHPAVNGSGASAFEPETGLKIKIVGTFTPGVAVPDSSKNIFNYDSANISLVAEIVLNTSPQISVMVDDIYGQKIPAYGFDLARVKSDGTNVIIQDKRSQYWETKGSNLPLEMERGNNPLIGIEAAKFNNEFTPGDRNIVEVAWGMRSDNWSIDSANNIVTFNSGLGGKFKTVNDFTNGDLNGFRLYTPNGQYHRILTSIKQGSAINFKTDVLEVNNFSNDGGDTLITGTLLVVPDCEEVEIKFTPDPVVGDLNRAYITETFKFPVNTPVAKCDVLVYADDTVLYNVKYRHKSFKEYTDYKTIPSDPIGFYTEASYLANGILKPTIDIVYFPYVANDTTGFVQLKLSPLSIYRFRVKIDKGDLIGVNQINDLSTTITKNLVVGVDKNYQQIVGNIVLANDVYFDLDKVASIEGNEFRIHFDCTSVDLAGKNIYITQGHGTMSEVILKTITKGDIYAMLNQDGGICFDLKYKVVASVGNWIMYQNYDLGRPFEIITIDGIIGDNFDSGTHLGKVKGLFGYAVCDGAYTIDGVTIPDLKKRFLIGADPATVNFHEGDTGGAATVTLDLTQIPAHTHLISPPSANDATGSGLVTTGNSALGGDSPVTPFASGSAGGGLAHENNPEYYAVIYAKQTF